VLGYIMESIPLYLGLQITSFMQIFAFAKPQSKSPIVPVQQHESTFSSEFATKPPAASLRHAEPVLKEDATFFLNNLHLHKQMSVSDRVCGVTTKYDDVNKIKQCLLPQSRCCAQVRL